MNRKTREILAPAPLRTALMRLRIDLKVCDVAAREWRRDKRLGITRYLDPAHEAARRFVQPRSA
jgi:hypothetical protein